VAIDARGAFGSLDGEAIVGAVDRCALELLFNTFILDRCVLHYLCSIALAHT
jgi:hypothetical protein